MITINQDTRQLNIPGDDLVFGVEFDAGSERKRFQCPRYVGDNLDLASCFVRINIRNANGDLDSYLVDDVTVDGDNVVFSWVLSEKAVKFRGQLKFVVCAVGPNHKVEWHTTLGTGMVLEGLEPEIGTVEAETADVVAQLIAMVEQQTTAVENIGAEWVRNVQSEGTGQIIAVQTAARVAQSDAVAEIEAKGVNTLGSIPDDYTALQSAVDALEHTRGAAIVCEAAGSTVIVNDASDNYIQGLRIFGRSTQDGTPTPEAPVEIVSVESPVVTVCGVNLLKNELASRTIAGVTFTVNNDGSITANGTSTELVQAVIFDSFLFRAGRRYKLTGCPSGGGKDSYRIDNTDKLADDGNGGFAEYETDTVFPVRIRIAAGATVSNLTFFPMLCFASVESDEYEPYNGGVVELAHTLPGIPVTDGGNYTDSNGQQWICDEVDLERGVYVQRVGVATMGSADVYSGYILSGKTGRGQLVIAPSPAKNQAVYATVCNVASRKLDALSAIDGEYYENPTNIVFVGSVGETEESMRAKYADFELLYVLATPIETPLSETEIAAYRALHSNYPNTTVLNDSGAHMVVKYAADTKLYIDNKIAALVGG